MSRLDSFIRRMSAQRDILNTLPALIAPLPGLLFEIGLGSGRTYDHLREIFPARRIVVFESVHLAQAVAHVPPGDFVAGDVRQTASVFPDGCAAVVHADIETGVSAVDATLASWLPALTARVLMPGGYAVSGCALPDPRLAPCSLTPGITEGRYHLYRRA